MQSLRQRHEHGPEFVVERPQYGLGKRANDYGLGFYCTEDKSLAGEWSVSPLHDGYVDEYEIVLEGLTVLNLDTRPFTALHRFAILLENRTFDIEGDLAAAAKDYLLEKFRPDYANADIIIGYRANDSCFSFARTFLSGALSYANSFASHSSWQSRIADCREEPQGVRRSCLCRGRSRHIVRRSSPRRKSGTLKPGRNLGG